MGGLVSRLPGELNWRLGGPHDGIELERRRVPFRSEKSASLTAAPMKSTTPWIGQTAHESGKVQLEIVRQDAAAPAEAGTPPAAKTNLDD